MVFQKVADILAEIIGFDQDDITLGTELTGSNGIKAVDLAKLVIECEKKFKLTIYDEDVHKFKYVKDIVDYIKRIQSDL